MENIHAIVLAAGKGTRMMSPLPKCAIPFLGKPMVKHITDDIERVGIRDIYIVMFKNYVAGSECCVTAKVYLSFRSEPAEAIGVRILFDGEGSL